MCIFTTDASRVLLRRLHCNYQAIQLARIEVDLKLSMNQDRELGWRIRWSCFVKSVKVGLALKRTFCFNDRSGHNEVIENISKQTER
ncbi:hypothetical protein C5167_034556 [Papaver somniferum]|uniref:Uncharacterized protein n=1 Tax=Papaver somniferum TaxID=3469 RepID=A0A4Y7KG68_PAPSO|nr:hypothetical protein C5167_034556 [Papaver somniferum]